MTAGGAPIPPLFEPVEWLTIGPPPVAVPADRARRIARVRRYGGVLAGLFFAGIVGFLAVIYWPGAYTGPFAFRVELFVAVGIPVGVAEYFVNGWLLALATRFTLLTVTRVKVEAGSLLVETLDGARSAYPLDRVSVLTNEVAGGWFLVVLAGERASSGFYVPKAVAAALHAAGAK